MSRVNQGRPDRSLFDLAADDSDDDELDLDDKLEMTTETWDLENATAFFEHPMLPPRRYNEPRNWSEAITDCLYDLVVAETDIGALRRQL